MSPRGLGLVAALVTLGLDQASKLGLLFGYGLPEREPLRLGSFVELVPVWNRGISYGLFQQDNDVGRLALIGVSCVACLVMAVWIWRASSGLLALSLGLVLGGAAGNAIDRAAYGAVFDFVHLHAGTFSWYVFNVADAAIVGGVAGLIWDALVASRQQASAV